MCRLLAPCWWITSKLMIHAAPQVGNSSGDDLPFMADHVQYIAVVMVQLIHDPGFKPGLVYLGCCFLATVIFVKRDPDADKTVFEQVVSILE